MKTHYEAFRELLFAWVGYLTKLALPFVSRISRHPCTPEHTWNKTIVTYPKRPESP
jgi:hypothetical protein